MGARCGLWLVALLAACGDDGASADTGPADAGLDAASDAADAAPPSPLDEYFAAIDDDACRRAVRCESRWRSRLGWSDLPRTEDELPCHPAFEQVLHAFGATERRALRAAVGDGRIRFDVDAAQACIDLLPETTGCPGDPPPEPCLRALSPAAVEGGACRLAGTEPALSRSYDCPIGLRCVAAEGCEGTCGARAGEGEPCRSITDDCDSNDGVFRFCDLRAGRCTRYQTVGETCDDVDGPRCGPNTYCRDGVCTAAVGAGTECGDYNFMCEYPLACIFEPDGVERCSDPTTGADGAPCIPIFYDRCAPDLACFAASETALGGTCRRPHAEGEICSQLEPCGQSLRCEAGRCLGIALPGEPCSETVLCPVTHYCSSAGRCAPLPLLGEPCADAGRCFHGMCSAAGVCELAPPGAKCDGVTRTPLGSCEGVCHQETIGYCTGAVAEGGECSEDWQCLAPSTCALLPGALRCTAWCGLYAP